MAKSKQPVKSPGPAVAWDEHHFLNRDLALDFANTVVYRHVPGRRDDRLTDRRAVDRWALASGRAVRLSRHARLGEAIRIREAIDGFFRHAALRGVPDAALWRRLVALYLRHGVLVPGEPITPSARPTADLFAALLLAALETTFSPHMRRIKVCPSFGWLFIDRTRNGRKRWCIPSLCGNRARARRFYERRTAKRRGSDLTRAAR